MKCTVLLALGSNLEPRRERVLAAMQLIADEVLAGCIPSSFYETEPVGYLNQPAFINAAIVGQTELDPHEVHGRCKAIEQRLGRIQREQWHEREIDVDVIIIEGAAVSEAGLEIPHPRMQTRRFVLEPCAEIAPYLLHPTLQCTVQELLERCGDTSAVKVVDSPPMISPHAHS